MDDEIAESLARLEQPGLSRREHFPVGMRVQRRKDSLKRRDRRGATSLIKAENAAHLEAALPTEEGDWLHGIIPGDFVFGDLLPCLIAKRGCPRRIDITTLSLSEKNVHALLGILGHAASPMVTLLLSCYFKASNADIFRAVETMLVGQSRFRLAVHRQHTKILLLDWPECALVVESSANLRSANCIEQVTARASRDLLNFHREWIDEIHALPK